MKRVRRGWGSEFEHSPSKFEVHVPSGGHTGARRETKRVLIDGGIRVLDFWLAGWSAWSVSKWHFMPKESEMNSSHIGDVVSRLGRENGSREVRLLYAMWLLG